MIENDCAIPKCVRSVFKCVTSSYMYLRYSKVYQIQLQVCTIKFNVYFAVHRRGKKLISVPY